MALLTTANVSSSGLVESLVAASGGGDTLNGGDRVFLTVSNGGVSSITVTVASAQVCNEGGTHNLSVSVGASATRHIGPLGPARYGAVVSVTYSAVTSVTVGAFTT